MFSNPLVAALTVQLLFFMGMVVIFVFIIRTLSSMAEEMREAFRKQQMFLSDLERQCMEMSFAVRRLQDGEAAAQGAAPPQAGQDDLLSMLDAAARNMAGKPLDDQLLPPTMPGPAIDEYDPAKDPHLFDDSAYSQNAGYSGRATLSRTGPKRDRR